MFIVHGILFVWHTCVLYKGQCRKIDFSTGKVCLLIMLMSKTFPFKPDGNSRIWYRKVNEGLMYLFQQILPKFDVRV